MTINKEAIGFKSTPTSYEVTLEKIQRYAAATNEDNPIFNDPATGNGTLLAPPCFAFTYALESMSTALVRREWGIDFLRLVHGEQEFIYHHPVRSGDRLVCETVVTHVDEKETGETITLHTKVHNQNNILATEAKYLFFVRNKKTKKSNVSNNSPGELITQPPSFRSVMITSTDQATRYGHASGDINPIHMDHNAGIAAGLGGVILQGLCTMAFASKAIIDHCAGGEAERLYRIKVRFAKPVIPGNTVTTRIFTTNDKNNNTTNNNHYKFETINQDGVQVIKKGEAEIK